MSTIEHFKNYGSKTGSLLPTPSSKSSKPANRPATNRPATNKQKPKKGPVKTDNKKGKSSISKEHWVKLLNTPTSKNLLKKVWNSKNPQQEYKDTIKKIASKVK